MSRHSGVSSIPFSESPELAAANSAARAATVSSNFEFGTISSTSRQSRARWPRTPSSMAQNTSHRSRRTCRLSVSRVSPPVPGNTARSGTSGSATVDEPSSTSMMWLQANASSYPPPAQAPRTAAIYFCPESASAASMAFRVSLVNLQKLTLWACSAPASILILAPAQKTRSFPDERTTTRTSGCSNRILWTISASSMSTPRS